MVHIEAHMHMGLRTGSPSGAEAKEIFVRSQLESLQKLNILYIRDGGDPRGFSKLARELSKEYGITYKTAVYGLYRKGHYGSIIGREIDALDYTFDANDAGAGEVEGGGFRLFKASFDAVFKELLMEKPDHLKIPLTGIMDFDTYGKIGETGFSKDELYYMIQCAHDRQLPVMVHANGKEAVVMAAQCGADSVEHGYFAGREGLEAMKRHNTVWVPTLAPLGNLSLKRPEIIKKSLPVIDRIYQDQLEALRLALDMGVFTAVGSDAGALCVERGQGYLDEIGHFKCIGLTDEQVGTLSFENGRRLMGI